jgi:transcriptional regulator with XRE-family HTH domain
MATKSSGIPPKQKRKSPKSPDPCVGKEGTQAQSNTIDVTQPATEQMKQILTSSGLRSVLNRMALLQLRKRLDLTQQELAHKLGISLRSFSRYETDGEPMSLEVLGRLVLQSTANGYADLAAEFKAAIKNAMDQRFISGSYTVGTFFNSGSTIHAPDVHRLQQAFRSFRDLWEVFQPELGPGEGRIRKKLDELLEEIGKILAEGKQSQDGTA